VSVLWTSAEAAKATGGQVAGDWSATGVSIDSRTVAEGDLFVALSAARDGHEFVADALAKGAVAAMVSRVPEGVDPARLLIVADVLEGLAGLGRAARARTKAKVVAVTGSVGKTTVKDMLRTALSPQGQTHVAEASYNNHWGVPVTLARMPVETDFAVIEIGMNAPGEIAPLARMARPDVAVVTTVAPAHLEAFGVIEGIAHEKASIYDGLSPGGVALAHADVGTARNPVRQGPRGRCAAGAFRRGRGRGRAADGPAPVGCGVRRAGAVRGAVAALQACRAGAAQRHERADRAGRLRRAGGRPVGGRDGTGGVGAGLGPGHAGDGGPGRGGGPGDRADRRRVQRQPGLAEGGAGGAGDGGPSPGGRRVAILGDMLELGSDAPAIHAEVADLDAMGKVDLVHTAGPLMEHLHNALPATRRGLHADTAEALAHDVPRALKAGDVVLVKGSKGSRVSRVVDALRKLGQANPTQSRGSS
jgi:UDP-N-acetylmuramoyl-tripeptide--D-alanyl-D-alanine ligase